MTTAALATDRRTNSKTVRKPLLLVLLLVSNFAYAGFDHEWALDQRGIWSRQVQTGLEYGVIAAEVAGSLWFGNDDPLGHTFWQTLDASAISGVGAVILKRGLSRVSVPRRHNP